MSHTLALPQGVTCNLEDNTISFSGFGKTSSIKLAPTKVKAKLSDGKIELYSEKGNKNNFRQIMTYAAHIANLSTGLKEKFVYTLESANVHFPMTLKKEGNKLIISNFLGEKSPRFAEIRPNVDVEIKGSQIKVSSHDRDAAGQTASNIEKATKIKQKDRRVFQDGIYLVEKPGKRRTN